MNSRRSPRWIRTSSSPPTSATRTGHKDWYDKLTGESLGKKDEAQQRLDDLTDRAGRIGDRIADADGNNLADADVSVVRIRDANTIRLYGEDTFSGPVLKIAGLTRPENQISGYPGQDYGMYVVSRENLDQADAD